MSDTTTAAMFYTENVATFTMFNTWGFILCNNPEIWIYLEVPSGSF